MSTEVYIPDGVDLCCWISQFKASLVYSGYHIDKVDLVC